MKTTSSGKLGEDYAVAFLERQGYKILERNFRSRFGEIDIVAQQNKTLVFVEVKTRWSKNFGDPAEAVSPLKIRHIEKAVHYFKLLHPETPAIMRIDVVATEVRDGKVISAKILKNISGF